LEAKVPVSNVNSSSVETQNIYVTSVLTHSSKLQNYILTKQASEKTMWNILVNLALKILAYYTGSPYAQQILNQVVIDLAMEGQKAVPIIIDAVKEAATDDKLSAKGKFDMVANTVLAQAPSMGRSVVTSLVNVTYQALKNDPTVPEVPK
jgi:hypothetical protein